MNYDKAMNYDIYFSILNITRDSTLNDIKKAYRLLSIKHHPDKNGNASSDQFNKINEAYSILISNYDSIKFAEKKQDIEYVFIEGEHLRFLPIEITRLTNLLELHVSYHNLTGLPKEIINFILILM